MRTIKLLIALLICVPAFAQQEQSDFLRPLQGDKAISFTFSGLSVLNLGNRTDPIHSGQVLDARYFHRDDIAFRVGLGVDKLNITATIVNDTTGGVPLTESETKTSQTGFSIGLGVEKHIKTKSNRVDPFMGAGLYYTTLGIQTVNATSTTTQTNGNYVKTESETKTPGQNAFALGLDLGFFWYFAPNIAFGSSFELGFATQKLGGDTETTTTTTSNTGGTITSMTSTSSSKTETKNTFIRTINTGTISILIKF